MKKTIRKDLANFLYDNLYNYTYVIWRTTTVVVGFDDKLSGYFTGFSEKEVKQYQKFFEKYFRNIHFIE